MLVVLVAAGAFVFWRVQFALDHRLDQDLRSQSTDLRQAAANAAPAAALASLRDQAREGQLLDAGGRVLASGPGLDGGRPLIPPAQARRATRRELTTGRGYLFSPRGRHLRILALPVGSGGPAAGAPRPRARRPRPRARGRARPRPPAPAPPPPPPARGAGGGGLGGGGGGGPRYK